MINDRFKSPKWYPPGFSNKNKRYHMSTWIILAGPIALQPRHERKISSLDTLMLGWDANRVMVMLQSAFQKLKTSIKELNRRF